MVAGILLVAGCAGGPGPGDRGYAYNVEGRYAGRLMIEGQPFDATFDLRTGRGGRVRGTYSVRAPLEIDGNFDGRIIDDLLRVTLTYEGDQQDAGQACRGRVEGILSISRGGGVVDGPITIDDCGDPLPGTMSFRRMPADS